jgi:hypothetical protein
MCEFDLILFSSGLSKAVHIELPHETRKIRMLEVLRQDLFAETVRVPNYECISFCAPTYDRIVNVILECIGTRTSRM